MGSIIVPDIYPFVGQIKRLDFILSIVESHCILSREITDITRFSKCFTDHSWGRKNRSERLLWETWGEMMMAWTSVVVVEMGRNVLVF